MAQPYLQANGSEKRIPPQAPADPFYSESNLRYPEKIMREVKNGSAHFTTHDLIEN